MTLETAPAPPLSRIKLVGMLAFLLAVLGSLMLFMGYELWIDMHEASGALKMVGVIGLPLGFFASLVLTKMQSQSEQRCIRTGSAATALGITVAGAAASIQIFFLSTFLGFFLHWLPWMLYLLSKRSRAASDIRLLH